MGVTCSIRLNCQIISSWIIQSAVLWEELYMEKDFLSANAVL